MKPTKKLAIKKETIRQLGDLSLKNARGAIAVSQTCLDCSADCATTLWNNGCGNSEGVRCPTYLNGCPVGY